MYTLESEIIQVTKAGTIGHTIKKSISKHLPLQFLVMVMQTIVEGKIYYCCLADGKFINGKPKFSPMGLSSYRALSMLNTSGPLQPECWLLQLGNGSIRDAIISVLTRYPENSKICFVGDIGGELDGLLLDAFNIKCF